MSFVRFFLLLLFISNLVFGLELPVTSVNTKVGQIYGKIGEDFTMYLGIPYGLIVENNPFGNAIPHPYFKTAFEAFKDSAICPQMVKGVPKGTIQCLHLNIYTPKTVDTDKKLPVIAYIHGGGFFKGNGRLSEYSPKFLIKHDVIFVTLNYRLGLFGQLCIPDSEYSNQGLKDQVLALKWIKDNIESFGGDDENIVLSGHSSGSVSVNLFLLFNNDNLFNKFIIQSGTAVIPSVCVETNSLPLAEKFGLGTKNVDVDSFVKKISTTKAEQIIEITKDVTFRPCIDGVFITKKPKIKNLQNIKIMIGGTVKEMLFLYPHVDDNYFESYNYVTELEVGFKEIIKNAADIVSKFYLNKTKHNMIDFLSDFTYNYPMERSIEYFIRNNATVYKYLFTYDGKRNYMKTRKNITAVGSTHADELGYLFDMPLFGDITEEEQLIIDRITYLWTNFAKYGNPTPTLTSLLPVQWQPVTLSTKPYLQIDSEMGLYTGPFQKNMAFWELFYEHYGIYSKGISLGENWQKCNEE